MRVLLIEDEPTMAKSIELMLSTEGFNVYTTDLGEEGLDLGKLYDYDIILLDLNLPDMHGYDVLKKLRTAKVSTPVLILSGMSEMDSKVRALGFGADDYVTKPFHRDELVARIHAIVRRSKGHSQSVIYTGKLAVNLDAKTVEVNGSRVHLTGKEYAILELLTLRKGTTITKDMLLNHLYGGMNEPELKIIDVFICKLRKKLSVACGGGISSNPQLRPIVGLLLLTGARVSELLQAEWCHIDLNRRAWLIPMSKTGKSRYVPLSQAAIDLIDALPRLEGCPWLIPNPDTGKPFVSIKHGWQKARNVALLNDLRIHDLRHSAASFMINAGIDLFAVGKVLGHADYKSTARYSHVNNQTLLSAVEAGAAKMNGMTV